ncbi:MAG: LysM peptidoglycan-binding domain-containing protein [Phycisphaerales bacterium]|nr:LysM peptidoglycan-binding domain-containing protein [Phycisphaerales bacterium]
MRGMALGLLVMGGLLTLGCNKPETSVAPKQGADVSYGAMQPDMYSTTPAESTPTSYDTATDPGYDSGPVSGSGRTHVVAKGDTLFKLARQYYNDQSKWRDIYNANRSIMSDPNRLKVGQELVLP